MSLLYVSSPWDGTSRAPLRRVLAALIMADALLTAWFLRDLHPSALSHPAAPPWLLAIGGNLPVLGVAVASVSTAAIHFAHRAGRIVSGLVAVTVVGLLVEAHAALIDGPMRFLFFSGAAMAGWCFGLLFARWQAMRLDDPGDATSVEALAEQGAVAVLAACYLGALSSKLAASGLAWVTEAGLQATLAAQHVWGDSALVDRVVAHLLSHKGSVRLLAAFTLLAQASAILLPFGRAGRAIAATLLLAFHAGVWMLTPIAFPQAMVLLAAFGLPWQLVRRPVETAGSPPGDDGRTLHRGAATRATVFWAFVAAIGWLPALRAYTESHHRRHLAPTAASPDHHRAR